MKNWKKRGEETSLRDVFLRNIGASSLEDINCWFRKSYSDEYYINDMSKAVELALKFKNLPVWIFGDYDVDGTTSVSTLLLGLRSVGFTNVSYRIPKRFSEGFGINETMIDEVSHGLIITCDNGIAQVDAINKAKEKGLSVIILDHHEPCIINGKPIFPNADVIIDPNAISNSATFNGYCGCGLCYKFIKALGAPKNVLAKALSMTALATVADVMDLKEENYVFVKNGFKALLSPTTTTKGVYALVSEFELNRHITAKDIGFKLGPALNACSRMYDDGARQAVDLLTYDGDNFQLAISKAQAIIELNNQRKDLKKIGIETAKKIIEENCMFGECPLILKCDVPEGIIGIIAGSICEEYGVPAIVLCDIGNGVLKGSGRSCGNYNIKEALDHSSEFLLKYGGHAGACGLSLHESCFEDFKNAMFNTSCSFIPDNTKDTIYYDLEIKANQIPDIICELDKYEPFGNGNPMPVFKITDYSVNPKGGNFINKVTSSYDITKLFYKTDIVAIGFDMSSRFRNITPKNIIMIGTLSDKYFNGNMSHQCEFIDFQVEKLEKVSTPLANKLSLLAKNANA